MVQADVYGTFAVAEEAGGPKMFNRIEMDGGGEILYRMTILCFVCLRFHRLTLQWRACCAMI